MAKILVVGLNPAWQKVLEFPSFRLGEVNRAKISASMASGKGFNAAKVLRRFGHEVWLLQILGGENGRRCLAACEAKGIRSLHVWSGGETRQCLTLLSGAGEASATELIEPFRVEEPGVGEALLDSLPAGGSAFDAVAVCGSAPPGSGDGIYDRLLDRLRPGISVIDAWQGLAAETLTRATCVKLNLAERESLLDRLGAESLGEALFLVTAGSGDATVWKSGSVQARLRPPGVSGPLNPIGAGDTVTAGVVHGLLQGRDASEAFRHALAMGTASCLERLPAEYSQEEYERLLPLVELRR